MKCSVIAPLSSSQTPVEWRIWTKSMSMLLEQPSRHISPCASFSVSYRAVSRIVTSVNAAMASTQYYYYLVTAKS